MVNKQFNKYNLKFFGNSNKELRKSLTIRNSIKELIKSSAWENLVKNLERVQRWESLATSSGRFQSSTVVRVVLRIEVDICRYMYEDYTVH